MNSLDKQRQPRRTEDRSGRDFSQEQRRRTKLQPVGKQKYRPKQVYLEDDDDGEIDLFGYLKDEEEDEDEDVD